MKNKRFNSENCDQYVRGSFERNGIQVTISGKHAHAWRVSKVFLALGKIYTQEFPNGALARQEFNRLKSLKKGILPITPVV